LITNADRRRRVTHPTTSTNADYLRQLEALLLQYDAALAERLPLLTAPLGTAPKPGRRHKPNRFLESEVRRAIRAARREGAERVEVDPATGRITVDLAKPVESTGSNSWDEVLEDAPHPKRPS
jgi:hypothetical protein